MAKKTAAKKTAATVVDESDPRFIPVIKAFARTPGFSLMESKSKATRGLRIDGKSFGMSSHGRFILKLDAARAEALIADRTAEAFEATEGKPMKGWVEITDPRADWVALAKEAQRMVVAGAKPKAPKKRAAKKAAGKARKTASRRP